MKKTFGSRLRAGAGVTVGALALLSLALPAAAQDTSPGRWLPFLGCWQAVAGPAQVDAAQEAVCVSARAAGGVELITVAEGRVTARRALLVDGQRHDVQDSGCAGWEQARWSEDGQRVYLRSELTCEGGTRRVTSGVIAMASPSEWLDVQSVEAGGYPLMRVLRYRPAPEEIARVAGVTRPEGLALALDNARTAASEPLSVSDVKEAVHELSTETLEALLFERGGLFDLNAATLVELADAGVPDRVVDLVVALAYPGVFAVNSDARMVGERPDEPRLAHDDDDRQRRRVYAQFDDPFYGYGYGSRYGYGYGYSPFGWGSQYGWYSGSPVIIVQPPSDGTNARSGRVVRGRGYTRDASSPSSGSRPSQDRSGDPGRATSTSGSTGGASATGSTGSSGSSSTGRTAKRRGG